jgi:hypothetical protein
MPHWASEMVITPVLPKISCYSALKNLDFYVWAVLGEGCSSARDFFNEVRALLFCAVGNLGDGQPALRPWDVLLHPMDEAERLH